MLCAGITVPCATLPLCQRCKHKSRVVVGHTGVPLVMGGLGWTLLWAEGTLGTLGTAPACPAPQTHPGVPQRPGDTSLGTPPRGRVAEAAPCQEEAPDRARMGVAGCILGQHKFKLQGWHRVWCSKEVP